VFSNLFHKKRFVTVFASVLRCFAVFCRCRSFVKDVLCNTVEIFCSWLLENVRNTRAYCDFFVFSSVFRRFSGVLCVLWKYCKTLAKHEQNTRKKSQNNRKTPQNTTKRKQTVFKTHLLTPQPEFANKTALLAPSPLHQDSAGTAPSGTPPSAPPPSSINQSIKGPHKATHGQGEATSSQHHHRQKQQTLLQEVPQASWGSGAKNELRQHLALNH